MVNQKEVVEFSRVRGQTFMHHKVMVQDVDDKWHVVEVNTRPVDEPVAVTKKRLEDEKTRISDEFDRIKAEKRTELDKSIASLEDRPTVRR